MNNITGNLTNNKYLDGIIYGISAMFSSVFLLITGLIDLILFPIMFFISIGVVFVNGAFLTLDIDKRLNSYSTSLNFSNVKGDSV